MTGVLSRADLVAAGYDVGAMHGVRFLHDLKSGHATHLGMCYENAELQEASINGQKPESASVGGTDRSAAIVLRKTPSKIFAISCPGGLIHEDVPSSTLSAIYYAAKHLKIKKFRSFFSDSAPLLPYMLGKKKMTGPHMKVWQETLWKGLTAELGARTEYKRASWKKRFRLAAAELSQRNADTIRAFIDRLGLSFEVTVIAASLNSRKGIVSYYDRPDPHAPFIKDSAVKVAPFAGNQNEHPKRFGCSCCDSRALHSHIYCAPPGEYSELNVIAGFIPKQKNVIMSGKPNSAWLQLEMSRAEGAREYVVTAHTKCGGIEALMEWSRTGQEPENPVLKAYLQEAKPIADEVMRYAIAHNFGDGSESSRLKVCRLAEMHVARVSATRIKGYVGRQSQVIANYIDIESQQAYAIPLIKEGMTYGQSIHDTYQLVKDYSEGKLITLFGLYNAIVEPTRGHVQEADSSAFRRALKRKRSLHTKTKPVLVV